MPERPGMPAWLTWAMLLAIAAVEIPIYWIAFQPFHGKGSTGSDVLSGTLAISTAVLMVLLPHLAGRTVRSRAATGSIKAAVLPALALMGVWGPPAGPWAICGPGWCSSTPIPSTRGVPVVSTVRRASTYGGRWRTTSI